MSELTHLNAKGEASMVDVAGKAVTERVAVAEGIGCDGVQPRCA